MIIYSEKMIHLPFPADHPYASHISKQKVFPSFANTSEDPKRGVEALNTIPLSSETPAAGYDVHILHKTKGLSSLELTSLRLMAPGREKKLLIQ